MARVLLVAPLACQFTFGQSAAPGGAVPDGRAIFAQRCSKCHGDEGEGISAVATIAGPSLRAEHNPGEVLAAVEVGPSHMPRFEYVLTVPEMRSVAHYVAEHIADIPLLGGNLSEGGNLFRVDCGPCHRSAVRGGALVFAGTNAPSLTDKSAAIIAGAIRWGPGSMPAFPPAVLTDHQLDSIVQYVQFMQQPPSPGGSPLNFYGPVAEGFAAWVGLLVLIFAAVWIERGGRG